MAGASGHDPEQKDLEFFMLPITSRSYQRLSQKLEDLNLNAFATAIAHPYQGLYHLPCTTAFL